MEKSRKERKEKVKKRKMMQKEDHQRVTFFFVHPSISM